MDHRRKRPTIAIAALLLLATAFTWHIAADMPVGYNGYLCTLVSGTHAVSARAIGIDDTGRLYTSDRVISVPTPSGATFAIPVGSGAMADSEGDLALAIHFGAPPRTELGKKRAGSAPIVIATLLGSIGNMPCFNDRYIVEIASSTSYEFAGKTRIALTAPADGAYGTPFGVNRRGDVVGIAESEREKRVIVWTRGIPRTLPDQREKEMPTGTDGYAVINNSDFVAFADDSGMVVWYTPGHKTAVVAPDGLCLKPIAINDAGDVVGIAYKQFTDVQRAFVCRQGVVAFLTPPGRRSIATAINNHGVIAGAIIDAYPTLNISLEDIPALLHGCTGDIASTAMQLDTNGALTCGRCVSPEYSRKT